MTDSRRQLFSHGFLFLAFGFLTACTSLQTDLPMTRLDLPETNGNTEYRSQFVVSGEATHEYVVTYDASVRPLVLTPPKLNHSGSVGLYGSYGVLRNLDLGLKTTLGRSPIMLTAKYQIIGSPLGESKKGDWSLAGSIGIGAGHATASGDQNGLFGPGGYRWKARIQTLATDAAVIGGYRLEDQLLVYTGAFYTSYALHTKINHDASDNGTSPAAEYTSDQRGYQRGLNFGLGIGLGTKGLVKLETIYSDLDVSPSQDWYWSYAASIGFRF